MKLHVATIEMIQQADAKALATCIHDEPNVVPVSTIRVVDNTIWLMNYFMGTTLQNIRSNPHVTLACWKGLEGVKINATVEESVSGELFEKAKAYVGEVAPTRILKSLLVLTPITVFDVTPEAARAGQPIGESIS